MKYLNKIKLIVFIVVLSLNLIARPVYAANTHTIDFDGVDQSLSIADTVSLSITGDISIEAWVKVETLDTFPHGIVGKHLATGSQKAYSLSIEGVSDLLNFIVSVDGTGTINEYRVTSDVIIEDVWTHVAVTLDSSAETAIFYINASSVTSFINTDNNVTSIFDSTADFNIGANQNGSSQLFDGFIDEVRVWSDIRTSTEILDNYQKELVGDEAGLVGYWKLNNGLLDETTNNNDLTNNNSAVFQSADLPFSASGSTNVATVNGVAKANISTINGVAIGSVATISGVN